MKKGILLSGLLVCGLLLGLSFAQELKTLEPSDYAQWQSLRPNAISANGVWASYQVTPNEGNDSLFIVNTLTDSVYKEAFGTRFQFSADSKYGLYLIGVSKKEQEKLQEKKESVHFKLAIIELATGKKDIYPEVSNFMLPKEGSFALLSMYKPRGVTTKGSDRVLINLENRVMRTLGNITDAGFNKSGQYLGYITEPANALGYGVEVMDLNAGLVHVLASDTLTFSGLTWQKEGNALAFFKQLKEKKYKEDSYEVYAFRNINKGWKMEVFNPISFDGFPEDMKIHNAGLQWADDRSALFFGIQDWELKKPKESGKEKNGKDGTEGKDDQEESDGKKEAENVGDSVKVKKNEAGAKKVADDKLPGVDVWHWKDPEIQPRQKITYNTDKNFSYLCMWNLDNNKFVQIADTVYRRVRLTEGQKHAVLGNETPYEPQFRLRYADFVLMDLATGTKTDLLRQFTGGISSSPGGNYLLYFKDKNWYTYDIAKAQHICLTEKMQMPFWDIRDDHPAEVRPSWGSGGWIKDDKFVLLYDEYDVWAFKPDGSGAQLLTAGRDTEVIFRHRKMDNEENFMDLKETFYFTAFGDKTKKAGMFSMKWGKAPVEMIYVDKAIPAYGFGKAKDAERYMWTESTYQDPPSLWVADAGLTNKKEIVQVNKQQSKYLWGKAELVNFQNVNGKELQGVLHYPAGYVEGKEYPMLVYIYELLSNGLHRYINPSDQSFYNITNYVQQGFFVFQPDIVYRLNDPGVSAVECVVPAVEKVISTGKIDKERIGLMGHSWGAYQTAFIITQTDLFSAAVAGAPLTDMISMYTEIYWNSGSPNQGIFETSQGRFTGPYWEILDKYIANSPIFQAQNIQTPLLVAFGDKDGAVDWHQGIELYTTMRRMEKPYVMLVYEGENHSVRKEENMLDYTKKINEWFNHYLIGAEPEAWITKGIPYLSKKKLEEAKGKK